MDNNTTFFVLFCIYLALLGLAFIGLYAYAVWFEKQAEKRKQED